MSTSAATSGYLLLFRGTRWDRDLPSEKAREVMDRWIAWFERLTKEGKAKAGQRLATQGKIVSGKKGQTVADGPFAESKEAIAGYFYLQVASLEEAVEIAKACPGLEYDMSVEVRAVDEQIGQAPQ